MAQSPGSSIGTMKVVVAMIVAGGLVGCLVIAVLSRPEIMSRFSQRADVSVPNPSDRVPDSVGATPAVNADEDLTQEQWDEIYAQWIDEAAGHPDDPTLPRSALGASDAVLLATDPLEIADMLRTTREFVEERSSSPRHAFALGRAAWAHGYDRIGLKLMERAAEEGSGAALAYLGYDAEERGELEMALHFFKRAQAQGFRSRDLESAVAALSAPVVDSDATPGSGSPGNVPVGIVDPLNLPPPPRFDVAKFNKPDIIRALHESDTKTLNKDRVMNTLYMIRLHETLLDQGTMMFVDNRQYITEVDSGLSTVAAMRLIQDSKARGELLEASPLAAALQGVLAVGQTRAAGGSIDDEVGAMTRSLAGSKAFQLDLLTQHAANDGRRLAIMYDASPDDFRKVYAGIRTFFAQLDQ